MDFTFAVQLFDDDITKFKGGGLAQNTAAARADLRSFLKANGPRGGTDLALAVRSLAEVKGAKECFLLTDGEGGGEAEMLRVARDMKARGTPLHCIGVDLRGNAQALLARVADAGGGECSNVDASKVAQEADHGHAA